MNWRAKVWGAIHNVIAHPLLVLEADWTVRFHNWTSDKAWSPSDEEHEGYDRDDLQVRLGSHFEGMEIMGELLTQHGEKEAFLTILDEAEEKADALFKEVIENPNEAA